MNIHGLRAIYMFEMARTGRTIFQSIVSPVVTTTLYFVVFGAAIGSRITQIDGVSFAAFIIPGLVMLSILTESVSNAAFGIHMPRFVGTIYEILSAPVSALEVVMGYVEPPPRSRSFWVSSSSPPQRFSWIIPSPTPSRWYAFSS